MSTPVSIIFVNCWEAGEKGKFEVSFWGSRCRIEPISLYIHHASESNSFLRSSSICSGVRRSMANFCFCGDSALCFTVMENSWKALACG